MSQSAMILCILGGAVPLVFVIALIIFFYKQEKISFKALGVGILVFVVFSQILEKLLHLIVLQTNHATSTYLSHHPIAYAVYGALAAGVFEEVGRYFGFRVMLRKFRAWKDGLAYGLGHGGIETLLVGTLAAVQTVAYGMLINQGQLALLQQKLPTAVVAQVVAMVHQPSYAYLFVILERIIALSIQIALSFVVLYGIRKKNILYLVLAVFLHAAVDFTPALNQNHAINPAVTEVVLIVLGIIATMFIGRSKRLFT